ncbi:MAG TPA: hypothetical protein VI299_14655, partial [Polyangiales bacterium]
GLDKEKGAFRLHAAGETFSAQRVISTIPITRAQALIGMEPDSGLRTVTMISLFYSFAGARNFAQSVLFNFSHAGGWKRLTMHSDFYGRESGREYFGVEVNASPEIASVEDAARDFRAHTVENGIFAGDLRLEGSHALSSAYPIYTSGAAARAGRAMANLRAFGVESFGRQGGFDYQPTARVSTIEAEQRLADPS